MTTREFSNMVDAAYRRCGVVGNVSCQVGVYSALPHGSIYPQTIREGEIVLIDDGCKVEDYGSDISRTFVYGNPTDKQKKVFDIVHKAQATALATARPGVPCHAIDDAARKIVSDASFGPDYKYFSLTASATASAWTGTNGLISSVATTLRSPQACASPTSPASTSPESSASALKIAGMSPKTAERCSPPTSPSLEHPFEGV